MQLANKRIAFLIEEGFEDLEFWVVYMRLVEEGATVHITGPKAGVTYVSKSKGLTATSEVSADDLSADDLAAVVVRPTSCGAMTA